MNLDTLRDTLDILRMTAEQLYVFKGLVNACHTGQITVHQPNYVQALSDLAEQLRAEFKARPLAALVQ